MIHKASARRSLFYSLPWVFTNTNAKLSRFYPEDGYSYIPGTQPAAVKWSASRSFAVAAGSNPPIPDRLQTWQSSTAVKNENQQFEDLRPTQTFISIENVLRCMKEFKVETTKNKNQSLQNSSRWFRDLTRFRFFWYQLRTQMSDLFSQSLTTLNMLMT